MTELVRVRSGNGHEHLASAATLRQCPYFEVKLARWSDKNSAIELDVDDKSLAVILRLLRYGPESVPNLPAEVLVMVLKDAEYLGVPSARWKHLTNNNADTTMEKEEVLRHLARMETCDLCNKETQLRRWVCMCCKSHADASKIISIPRTYGHPDQLYAHMCERCGPEYARQVKWCLICSMDSLNIKH
ncbi:MAG: hypothetical protein WC700_04115 [Gemmatimonadaceae bacterium]|jgi:hypothetical protein